MHLSFFRCSKKSSKKNKNADIGKSYVSNSPAKAPLVNRGYDNNQAASLNGSAYASAGVPRIPRATTTSWDSKTNLEMTPSNSRQNLVPAGRNSVSIPLFDVNVHAWFFNTLIKKFPFHCRGFMKKQMTWTHMLRLEPRAASTVRIDLRSTRMLRVKAIPTLTTCMAMEDSLINEEPWRFILQWHFPRSKTCLSFIGNLRNLFLLYFYTQIYVHC